MDEQWTPPREFDGLELIRPLGAGGMGAVHLAREVRLDRLVAVKFVSVRSTDPRAVERFQIEARALARLQHPNIVAIYRIGEVDDRPYIAYEYVDGQRLDSLPQPLPWPQVLAVVLGIARGLAAAHARGVLHRDLKPANLMIAADGDVKLLDFGLARIVDPARGPSPAEPLAPAPVLADGTPEPVLAMLARLTDEVTTWHASADTSTTSDRLTEAGSLVGTPLYLAPELWNGAPATVQADLYGLGLIAYELLMGHHPREHLHGVELARRVQRVDLPRLSEEMPLAPRPLTELIDQCVARDPAARPTTAREVRDALEMLQAVYRPFLGGAVAAAANDVGPSFERVAHRSLALAEAFYQRWFEEAPAVRALFEASVASQPRMLAAALKLAVENLRDPHRLIPVLEDLGRRHAGRGVHGAHFTSMGVALIATLADFDPAWTEPIRQAWTTAYHGIAHVLRRALEHEEAARHGRTPTILPFDLPPAPPVTRWLQQPGGDVAWQALGHGPVEVVVLGEWVTDVDAWWRHPLVAGFFLRLAEDHRVILFDRRGTGASARRVSPTLEAHVDDLRDVLDAAGTDRAVLLALGDATPAAALFAATHPGRVRGLVTVGAGLAAPSPELAASATEIRAGWGGPVRIGALAPSLATDPAYRHWWAGLLRSAASPSCAVDLLERAAAIDARAILPALRTPTLIVHRTGDRLCPPAAAIQFAAAVPGARRCELPGADHVPWAGDADALLAAILAFIDELPTETHSSTAAAAVLAVATADTARGQMIGALVSAEVARHRGVPAELLPGLIALKSFDAPARALRCAHALLARAAEEGVAITIGLDVGAVAMGRTVTGSSVERAAALARGGAPGHILATASLVDLIGDSTVADLEVCDVDGARVHVARRAP